MRRPSSLALVVLVLLFEQPLHTYRMHRLIQERGKGKIVNVARRNSVQQAVSMLAREGLVEVAATERTDHYPARTVYRITAAGTRVMRETLHEMLRAPATEYPEFPVALASMATESPTVIARLLAERRATLAARLHDATAAADTGLPRILLIEDEYAAHRLRAELSWLDTILEDLRAGTLTWDTAELIGRSAGSG